ncbi:hypothetical protein CDU01_12265 [Cronobacter sakazakii]|nr:hypothetical protein [Cronobacter sakazakii]EGT5652743.1 hypothetical protein [Cronobacter sakazakii]EGT5749757.1 hypothetical protein [Cronobacter sakazakii]EGT5752348.1 hypothetical protein [Cronobacter sakazakii]EJG0815756.1 hypothetical protein [Cronobacter sakazakii]
MVALSAVARKKPDTGIQNKSGCFSLASGNGRPAGGSLPVTVAGQLAGLSAPGLLCPQARVIADRHTKKPHAFA